MQYILTAIISAVTVLASLWGTYNFVPLSVFDSKEPVLGSTITTINATDTLKDSRAVINTNFTNLNTDVLALMATTSMKGVTTLAGLTSATSLASVGTITSGTWSGTAIAVAKGGTGTTSPSSNQVILGNGSSGFKVVSGFGTSGQFLTSAGAGSPPTWTTGALDYTADYNWTGTTTIKNLHASSTSANPMYLNGIDYAMPSTEGASSTALMTNGSGSLTWENTDWQLLGESILAAPNSTTTVSISARNDLKIVAYVSGFSSGDTVNLRFNSDGASNYGYKDYEGLEQVNNGNGARTISMMGNSTSSPLYFDISVGDISGGRKYVSWNGTANSASSAAPVSYWGSGVWSNTSDQITSVQIVTSATSVTFNAGTTLRVYGSAR